VTTTSKFEKQYKWAINPEFQPRNQVFIDQAKQNTAQGSYLYPCAIPVGQEPQTYLWKRCCLESFVDWFCTRPIGYEGQNRGRRRRREPNNKPEVHLYSVALTRDVANLTIHFPIGSKKRRKGLIYSQFYSEVHAPFNAARVTPFENKGYENLAVDLDLIDAIQYAGGSIAFDPRTCERGYLNSKNRANQTTLAAQYKSLGTQEEFRISLELSDSIQPKLVELLQQGPPPNCHCYYVVPSQTLFSFLRS
jgi:hypothetical protein